MHKFSVFTFMPSKIEIETIQYRKSRIWEMKGNKYLKGLTKDHVCAIFHYYARYSEKCFNPINKALYGEAIYMPHHAKAWKFKHPILTKRRTFYNGNFE